MTMTYYKATRLDGTDFCTGTVNYGAGGLIAWRKAFGDVGMVRGAPSTYFSLSTEPGEVLTGGEWPCRLFRVEPRGKVIGHPGWPWKRCCRVLEVMEELPAHEALGPNGQEAVTLLSAVSTLTHAQAVRLATAVLTRSISFRYTRHNAGAVSRALAASNRQAAVEAAGNAAAGLMSSSRDLGATYSGAVEAARNAVCATIGKDVLRPADYRFLYRPWATVMMGKEV